jgi:hypothetical protein
MFFVTVIVVPKRECLDVALRDHSSFLCPSMESKRFKLELACYGLRSGLRHRIKDHEFTFSASITKLSGRIPRKMR